MRRLFYVFHRFFLFFLFLFFPEGTPRYPPAVPTSSISKNITQVINLTGSLPLLKKSDSITTNNINAPPVVSPDKSPFSLLNLDAKKPPKNALRYRAVLPSIPDKAAGSSLVKQIHPKTRSKTALDKIETRKPFTLFFQNSVCKKIHPFIKTFFC